MTIAIPVEGGTKGLKNFGKIRKFRAATRNYLGETNFL